MQAPVDYPINDLAHSAQFSVDELTYATLLDRMDSNASSTEKVVIHIPDFSIDDAHPQTCSEQSLLKPLTQLAQSLLARDNNSGYSTLAFYRWNRALR